MSTEANDISALRSALFETLRGVKAGTIEIDRAKAINDTARVIVDTARAEIDYIRVTGSTAGTDFIPASPAAPAAPVLPGSNGQTQTAHGTKSVQQIPGGSVTTHRMK